MKSLFKALLFLVSLNALKAQSSLTFHDYSAVTILGDTINLSQYYGKKVMVVNTASYCGYTPQFNDLQSLYSTYQSHNFEIIGFPCNDFSNQDPNSDSAILQFCTDNYHVSFQMMHKIQIVTGDTAPVYKWLQRGDLNGVTNNQVSWNFNKFLIDEGGNWVAHYNQNTLPNAQSIVNWILSPSVISDIAVNEIKPLIHILSSNPVSNLLSLRIDQNSQSTVTICLYTQEGRLAKQIYQGAVFENQIIESSMVDLSNGIYLLRINGGTSSYSEKIVMLR